MFGELSLKGSIDRMNEHTHQQHRDVHAPGASFATLVFAAASMRATGGRCATRPAELRSAFRVHILIAPERIADGLRWYIRFSPFEVHIVGELAPNAKLAFLERPILAGSLLGPGRG